MTDRLKDKVALVTGGGSGIGRAAALAFAREGARAVVADVDEERGQATVNAIGNPDSRAMFVKAHVSQRTDVEVMIDRTVDLYGRLDCAFNNAGIEGAVGVATSDYPEDTWDEVININLKGIWLCMKHELSQTRRELTAAAGSLLVSLYEQSPDEGGASCHAWLQRWQGYRPLGIGRGR
jgi:NAD(P)-dependent dehydrogenase (short-subunit alcohol dehydrogenase family)